MNLRQIDLRVSDHDLGFARYLRGSNAVVSLFKKKMKAVDTGPYSKINIYFSSKSEFKIGGLERDVLDCFVFFDFNYYLTLKENDGKKRALLKGILDALVMCADEKEWNKDLFFDAYNECLGVNLRNEWWFKNRLFKSPNKQTQAGLFNIHDLEGYIVNLVVQDQSGKELGRRVVFKDDDPNFPIEWASWEGSNDIFYFKFDPPKKIFSVKIKDVIDNAPYSIPNKTADWFK